VGDGEAYGGNGEQQGFQTYLLLGPESSELLFTTKQIGQK
jgi:hypothetical protein